METQDIIGLIIVYLIIAGALCLSLYVEKKGINWDTRKIVHIGVGAFIYIWWVFTANWVMLAFFAIPFEIVLILAALPNNPISNSKLGDLSNDGHRWGLVLYVATIIIMVVCLNANGGIIGSHWLAATIAIVAMTRGDGFGSIIGRKYGKHKTIHGKSLEGSIGVFVATFLISLFVIGFYVYLAQNPPFGWDVGSIAYLSNNVSVLQAIACAFVAGLVASVLEAVCNGDYDNVVMPCTIAALMCLMGL